MKEDNTGIEKYRIRTGLLSSDASFGNNGAFVIQGPRGRRLYIIASDGAGWEHVSVSRQDSATPPLWDEMCYVKDLFWDEDEVVMQLHPKKSEYVNNHPGTLHLWKPVYMEIPIPPSILVGIQCLGAFNVHS